MQTRFPSFFIYLLITSVLFACQPSSTNQEETKTTAEVAPETQPEVLANPGSITVDMMKLLWEECDYVDIIFYDNPLSVSQNDKGGIRATLQFISTKPVPHMSNCKPTGRLSFMIQGDIIAEADIYLSQGCTYFAFLKDGKIIHVNEMTPDGIKFISQVRQSQPGQNG
jgi:hypothetical protein